MDIEAGKNPISNDANVMMQAQLERIRKKIAVVHRNEWLTRTTQTGVDHEFSLNPVITPEALEEFESQYHIILPEAYRSFLLTVGNGGLGPEYGLFSLTRLDNATLYNAANNTALELVNIPCPLIPGQVFPIRHWENMFNLSGMAQYQGTIAIADCGDGIYFHLIVTGPARGHVVRFDSEGYPPWFARRSEFLAWYEEWLDIQVVTKQIAEALSSFVATRQLGRVTGETSAYKVFDKSYYRSPISYISTEKQVAWPRSKRGYQCSPDLTVEVAAEDPPYDFMTKVPNYLVSGTTVWIVNLKTEHILVCNPHQQVKVLSIKDTLTGGDVLPNFEMLVADVFANVITG